MPIMLPGILIGVGLVVFLAGTLHIQLSQMTVIAGHLVLTMPFVILIVAARLQGFDRRLEWAAADLGASPARVIRLIVLPLIAPAVLAAALISITLSIDEFVVTFFTVGSQLTLPIYIYTQIKFGVTPEVNAVATLVMVGTILVLGLITLVATRGRRAGRAIVRRVRRGG
jgi:ABC-type spermidine/putrescine transport system permease subunit II